MSEETMVRIHTGFMADTLARMGHSASGLSDDFGGFRQIAEPCAVHAFPVVERVDERGVNARGTAPLDVRGVDISDVQGRRRVRVRLIERVLEETRVGFLVADDVRIEHPLEIGAQPKVYEDLFHGTVGIADDDEAQAERT